MCRSSAIKFHYCEKYVYGMAQTADALEVARRAATWLHLEGGRSTQA